MSATSPFMVSILETVQVSDKYRIVISEGVRKSVPIEVGQEVLEIPLGDAILIVPLPKDPDKVLRKYLGDVRFSRRARENAEKLMVDQA
ncbi:MAG: AbrB/MazE/SpoVT family DNA-binding domain-containing protein [Candidatus Bathyarchaeia archaeon]